MKKHLLIFFSFVLPVQLVAQITTPQIIAGFGIDAELKANYYNAAIVNGNHDWFSDSTPGTGKFIIDTTGASAILQGYTNTPATLNQTIIRTMSYPPFSVVDNSLLIDAVFVRDFHGDDSTIFASGGNKNGMSPVNWSTPIAQSVPDKNEILDVFMHVRREGNTATDSLWMFGGLSIENTTGDRYFDFEMYQTDIVYNRSTQSFTGYGPDAGHTSWKFDASGNAIQAGDIIFTAEYNSSTISMLEARIWVDSATLTTVNPATFNWSGQFDGYGNGAQFGYASIVPKNAGSFYSGLENDTTAWAGPFGLVLGNNSVQTDYTKGQFMEFSVNLTKLGLDPVTLLGGSTCTMPFRRVMVKTRASTSFTAALKDFVAPFEFQKIENAKVAADIIFFCGVVSVSNLKVINPLATSIYEWSTPDGHIADSSNSKSIYIDAPGTYIVTQKLQSPCPVNSSDSIKILFDPSCGILATDLNSFSAKIINNYTKIDWVHNKNQLVKYFEVERSTDGIHFRKIKRINGLPGETNIVSYSIEDDLQLLETNVVYYRLLIVDRNNAVKYSETLKVFIAGKNIKPIVTIAPNPVSDKMKLNIFSHEDNRMQVLIFNWEGKTLQSFNSQVSRGNNSINIAGFQNWQKGLYFVKVILGKDVFIQKMMLTN